jgi:hypothetical protein
LRLSSLWIFSMRVTGPFAGVGEQEMIGLAALVHWRSEELGRSPFGLDLFGGFSLSFGVYIHNDELSRPALLIPAGVVGLGVRLSYFQLSVELHAAALDKGEAHAFVFPQLSVRHNF